MHTSRFVTHDALAMIAVVIAAAAVAAAATVALTLVPLGVPAHAATAIEFGLSESVYDLGSGSDVKFSFTGKVVDTSDDNKRIGQVNIFVSQEQGVRTLLSGFVNSEDIFVTSPRLVSEVFKSDGQYTATAFTHDQKAEDGTSIKLEFRDNLLYVPPDFELVMRDISDKTVTEGDTVSFNAAVTDGSINGVKYTFLGPVPQGATLDPDTGKFSWTPDLQRGSKAGAIYKFQVLASKIPLESTASFVITVKDFVQVDPVEEPESIFTYNDVDAGNTDDYEGGDTVKTDDRDPPTAAARHDADPPIHVVSFDVPAPFVDENVDSQTYVDRYNTDEAFRQWFDTNYPEYDSIYHAVGLPDPSVAVPQDESDQQSAVPMAPFVDPSLDAQTYVDRYNSEPSFKQWFDENYLDQFGSIYDAVGVLQMPAEFVDAAQDPQTYVDRYNTEDSFKQWFDANYPEYDSIHHAVGLAADDPKPPDPVRSLPRLEGVEPAPFVDPSEDPQTYVDRYNTEDSFRQWFDANYLEQYNTIYRAVGLLDVPAAFVDPSEDPQTYVDRYNTEDSFRQWFDENYSEYLSIYHAVGLSEPSVGDVDDDVTDDPVVLELPPPVVAPGAVVPPGLVLQPGQEFGECGPGTELVDDYCVIIGTGPPSLPLTMPSKSEDETKNKDDDNSGGGDDDGGCLIATAVYGSELAPQVQMLREIRDTRLMTTGAGASFMTGFNQVYYSFSPFVADYERENQLFRDATRSLLTPLLATLSIMNHADSESKVLAYGIGVILLNIAMYVGMPVASASYAFYLARNNNNDAHKQRSKQNND